MIIVLWDYIHFNYMEKQLYIGCYDSGEGSNWILLVSSPDKNLNEELKKCYKNDTDQDLEEEDIVGVYPIIAEYDSDGRSYDISLFLSINQYK